MLITSANHTAPLSSENKTCLISIALPAWLTFCSHGKIPANNNPFKRHKEGKRKKRYLKNSHVPGKRKKHLWTTTWRFSKYRLENTRATYVRVSDASSYRRGHTGYAAALRLQWPKGHCLTRSHSLCLVGNTFLTNTSIRILSTVLSLTQQAHNTWFSYILNADCWIHIQLGLNSSNTLRQLATEGDMLAT